MKYLIGFLLLASLSCKKANNKPLPDELYKMQMGSSTEDSAGYQNMVLRLYKDGTYSHYAANFFNFGTWNWSDTAKLLTLTPKTGRPSSSIQMFVVEKSLDDQFRFKKIKKEGNLLLREKGSSTFSAVENISKADPFSPENNSWRIKPSASETAEQIKERTRNYLKFLKAYYQHSIDNNISNLVGGWYATPMQMNYNNGVRMSYNTEVKEWYACFYNDAQAIEGYKLLTLALRKLSVSDVADVREKNLAIVKQMLDEL